MHRLSNQTEVCPQPWILSNVKMLQVFEVVLQVVGQKSCTSLANVASWNDKIREQHSTMRTALQGREKHSKAIITDVRIRVVLLEVDISP